MPGKIIYEFGEWRLYVSEHLLLFDGEPVSLTPKVFDTLVVLVENAGKLVPKDEFFRRVWPDAFVEEAVLSQNISVLRKTLNGNGVLIETVPKLGYRFVTKVEVISEQKAINDAPPATTSADEQTNSQTLDSHFKLGSRRVKAALVGAAILAVGGISVRSISRPAEPKVLRFKALTSSGRAEPWGGITVDGSRLYFLERQGGRFQLLQTSIAGGEGTPVAAPFSNTRMFGLSPDGSQFLIGNFVDLGGHMPLSTWPTQGGAPHRIGDVMVDDAVWFPDGKRILYTYNQGVFYIDADGTNSRHLFDVNGSAVDFSWRPDGSVFRFTIIDAKGNLSIWEAALGAQSPTPLLPRWADPPGECCGSWTPDGRNYIFSAYHEGPEDLWVLPESEGLLGRGKRTPIRLTNGPLSLSWPVPDKDGKRLFVFGLQYRLSAVRFDSSHNTFVPYLKSQAIFDIAFSRDGKWVAYTAEGLTLWRSRTDGTETLQLTAAPFQATRPRWSPDGSHILFVGFKPGTTSSTPYMIPSNGGAIAPLVKEGTANFGMADWSPDGTSVVVDAVSGSGHQEEMSLVNIQSHSQSSIPGSKDKDYVRWSPDGRYLAARSEDEKELFIFDFRSQQWKHLASAQYIPRHEWDPNSRDLYFQDALSPAQTVFRVNVKDGKIEPVLDFNQLLAQGATRCTFEGRTPDGSYLASVRGSVSSLYSLDVKLP